MKQMIIDNVLRQLVGIVETQQLKTISNILVVELDNYKVAPVQQDLMIINNDWQKVLESFLATKMIEGKSLKTIEQYGFELKKLLSYLNKPVGDVTDGDIFKYFGTYKKLRKVGNQTLENKRLVFSSFFTWIHNRGKIARNPMLSISTIKTEKRIKKPYTDEERQRIFEACKNVREKALVEFLYSTCVRVGELVKVDITDINFLENEVIVFGKGSKERKVYINAKSSMYLRKYIQSREDVSDALFVSIKGPGERLTEAAVEAILRDIGKRAGVDNVHPHRFRRTGATNALMRGMPLQEVSAMLGHVKLETTLIYCTLSDKAVKYSHEKYLVA